MNGMRILDPEAAEAVSLHRLRKLSIPELGNVLRASWQSTMNAMQSLDAAFELVEATSRFRTNGPPMLNLLCAPAGVYVAAMEVTVNGVAYPHCIAVSTTPEAHAPWGKLVDNGERAVPLYVEAKDREHKVPAKKAFQKLFAQKIKDAGFAVNVMDVYQLLVKRA